MVMHFSENMESSFSYANHAFKSFGGWFAIILLVAFEMTGTVLLCLGVLAMMFGLIAIVDPALAVDPTIAGIGVLLVPFSVMSIAVGIILTLIAGCFVNGFVLRVYRGGELTLARPMKMFIEGLAALLIICIYMIPYVVISILTMLGPLNNMPYLIIVGIIIPTIILIISIMIAMNAVIRYAKEEHFGAAFQLKKICSIISRIGWLRYFGYWILISIIIGVIECILMMIPILGMIMLIVVLPFILIFQARFLANLYESVEEKTETAVATTE